MYKKSLQMLAVFFFFYSSRLFAGYWWQDRAIGITIGHGSEENRYDRGLVASAGFHDGFLTAWKIGDDTKKQSIPIGSIPTEVMFYYLTPDHKFMRTVGVINRRPRTLTSRSENLYFTGYIGETW